MILCWYSLFIYLFCLFYFPWINIWGFKFFLQIAISFTISIAKIAISFTFLIGFNSRCHSCFDRCTLISLRPRKIVYILFYVGLILCFFFFHNLSKFSRVSLISFCTEHITHIYTCNVWWSPSHKMKGIYIVSCFNCFCSAAL